MVHKLAFFQFRSKLPHAKITDLKEEFEMCRERFREHCKAIEHTICVNCVYKRKATKKSLGRTKTETLVKHESDCEDSDFDVV